MSAAAVDRASVVICAYANERFDDISAAVNSVLRQTLPPREIILVVDHNQDLQARLRGRFPTLAIAANTGPRGLSAARNTGMRMAQGDIVAFLDDDAVAEPDWLEGLLKHYDDPDVAAVGGAATPVWPTERPKWFPQEFDWVVGCSIPGRPGAPQPVRNLIGCNMSARRLLIEEAGSFNEGLGRIGKDAAGCEETELFIKIHQANPRAKVIYDPSVVVRHRISAERTHWRYFRARCVAEGRSKARLSTVVGRNESLSEEKRYTTRVLPLGVLRGIADACLRFDPWGLARAGNIVAGLFITAWAFTAGRSRVSTPPRRFAPIRIVEFELDDDGPVTLDATDPSTDIRYESAHCLVRRGGRAVGVLEIPSLPAEISAETLGAFREQQAAEPIPAQAAVLQAPPASIVVATRDRADSLARCLDSLLRQDYPHFDIVVADSAPSSSETATMIAQRYGNGQRVRYTQTDMPGLGHAHNCGLALVSSPVVAFTDDDVIADRNWLQAIARNFDGRGTVGCVTGLILPAELETRAQVWTERHGAFGKGFSRLVYALNEPPPGNPLFPYTAGQFGSGANMAFSTEALKRIGGFDPALGAGTRARGGDDLLAFFRVLGAGYRLVYEPQAIVRHFHRRQEEGMRRQALGYGMGLGAYLTSVALSDPASARRLAAAVPAGLRHMWGPSSARMQGLPADYPRDLVWRERLGVLLGPVAYVRSRIAVNRTLKRQKLVGPVSRLRQAGNENQLPGQPKAS